MVILLIFIFSVLFLGSFHIGEVSIRVIVTILTVGLLIIDYKKEKYTLNVKPLIIYGIFLFIAFLSKMIVESTTGVRELEQFGIRLLSNFLVCFVAFFAVDRYVSSNKTLIGILLMFVCVDAINGIATYLQYIGNPVGLSFVGAFSTTKSEYVHFISDNMDRISEASLSLPGIFSSSVLNGYMSSTLGVMSLYYVVGNGRKYWIIGVIVYAVALIGSFCCQERSGFGLLLIFSIITLYKFTPRLFKYFFPILVLVGFFFVFEKISEIMTSDALGRISDMTTFEAARQRLVNNALSFIKSHFLWGGDVSYSIQYGLTPHNIFLHSMIYSGIFGAVTIIVLFCYLIYDASICIWKLKSGVVSYFFACALIIYMLNSVFHSASLITGEVAIWIMYACMIKGIQFVKPSK